MSLFAKTIALGGRAIGDGHPCFVAAEIGINHNGDMALARRAIQAAVEAGADGVKFQNYETADFLADDTLQYTYQSQGREVTESQLAMFKRCELSEAQLRELKAYCDELGTVFFSTPTSARGVEILKRLNSPLVKNGSDFLPHLDLIRTMARSGMPTVLSTGMATVGEIDDAVEAFGQAGGRDLIVLHCTSSYPTPPCDINLRRIPTLRATYGVLSGFSDHSEGTAAAVGAVVLGACFVEKHFTVDRGLPGPDHRFSSDPQEFAELVRAIRAVEEALGSERIRPTPSEAAGRASYRLSCLAAEALPAGTRLDAAHIVFRRPGTGIAPKQAADLQGMVLRRAVPKGHVFQWGDFHE